MFFDPRHKIELVTTGYDDLRPILCHVNVTRFRGQPVAVAADGFVLAVVPVQMEDEDVSGLVLHSVFSYARTKSKHHTGRSRVSLPTTTTAVFENGWTAPRTSTFCKTAQFPDYMRVVDQTITTLANREASKDATVAFNPKLMGRLSKALDSSIIGFHIASQSSAILVTTTRHRDLDKLSPPFALIMPMHFA